MSDTEQIEPPAFDKNRAENLEREEAEIPNNRRIDEQSGLVVLDFRGCGVREACDVYQAFALLCARETVSSALVKTGDEDADVHYALRDVLATLARVAGIPLHLSLALVTGSPSIAQVCGTMQGELRSLGCDARVFCAEPQASEWLRAASSRTAAAAARPAGSRIPA